MHKLLCSCIHIKVKKMVPLRTLSCLVLGAVLGTFSSQWQSRWRRTRRQAGYIVPDRLSAGKHEVIPPSSAAQASGAAHTEVAVARMDALKAHTLTVLPMQVADLDLCKVFLMDDATYPCWLVLVPKQVRDRRRDSGGRQSSSARLSQLHAQVRPWQAPVEQCRTLTAAVTQDGLTEVTDLSEADQQQLWREVARCSQAVRRNFPCDKLNIATLGNVVSDLHVHVTARLVGDAAWPGPVRLPSLR